MWLYSFILYFRIVQFVWIAWECCCSVMQCDRFVWMLLLLWCVPYAGVISFWIFYYKNVRDVQKPMSGTWLCMEERVFAVNLYLSKRILLVWCSSVDSAPPQEFELEIRFRMISVNSFIMGPQEFYWFHVVVWNLCLTEIRTLNLFYNYFSALWCFLFGSARWLLNYYTNHCTYIKFLKSAH